MNAQVTPYSALPNSTVRAASGINDACRDSGGREGNRALAPSPTPTTVPAGGADRTSVEEPFLFLRDSGVISGEISWPGQVMRRLAHTPPFATTEGEGVPLGSSL